MLQSRRGNRNAPKSKQDVDEATQVAGAAHTGRRPQLPVRQALLPQWNTLVVSNLANADRLPEAGAWLIVGVLTFRGGSGSPARVLGVLPR